MPKDRTKACAFAALRALGCHVLFYFVALHMLVAWKWNTTGPTVDQLVVEIVNPLPREVASLLGGTNNSSGVPTPETVDELLQSIKTNRKAQESTVEQARDLLEEFQKKLAQWRNPDRASSVLPKGAEWNQSGLHLGNLLQQLSSLSEMKDNTEVKDRMEMVTKELQGLVDQKRGISWADIQDILVAPEESFPLKEKLSAAKLYDMVCPSPVPLEEENDEIEQAAETTRTVASGDELQLQDLSLYASEHDLELHFSMVESVLDHRKTKPQERFENNSKVETRLQDKRKLLRGAFSHANGIVDATVEEVSKAPASSSKTSGQKSESSAGCNTARDDDILDLVNAGLVALARHQDLRSVLLQSLKEIDAASADNLILDADFSTEPAMPSLPLPKVLTVQRVLDTPLLRNLAAGCDRFLDIIGGYNDSLDQYVDQLQERLVDVHNKDASSLGKVLVATLLVRSGHLQVPIPEPVQQILQQSNGGRAVLASVS